MGNPVGVVLDGAHLTTDQMLQFARWTNLAETTFILPPTIHCADYRVKIFTPSRELPFAGHPTLGSCFAWLAHGGSPISSDFIIQECELGLIKLRRGKESNILSFEAPEPTKMESMEEEDVIRIAKGLRIERSDILDQSWCVNGPQWRGVVLGSMEKVLAVTPDEAYLRRMDVGIIGIAPNHLKGDFDYEVRAFCDEGGVIVEDPVTGSLNAALAQWLMRRGHAPAEYTVRQGTMIDRNGRVRLSLSDDNKVWVGGCVTVCIEGVVHI